jgi:hypothetical protein
MVLTRIMKKRASHFNKSVLCKMVEMSAMMDMHNYDDYPDSPSSRIKRILFNEKDG